MRVGTDEQRLDSLDRGGDVTEEVSVQPERAELWAAQNDVPDGQAVWWRAERQGGSSVPPQSQVEREQLSAGLESLKPGLAAKLNVITLDEALDASPRLEGELHLRLTLSREHARLSLYQSYEAQAPLYAFPERYALTDRARPSESAALLLSHLTLLSAELSH